MPAKAAIRFTQLPNPPSFQKRAGFAKRKTVALCLETSFGHLPRRQKAGFQIAPYTFATQMPMLNLARLE